MARTKETASKNLDDQRSSDERQQERRDDERQREQRDDERQRERDSRRRDSRRSRSNNSPPRRRRRASRSPLPRSYVCALCRKVNKQRRNHRRHLVMQHKIRIDGTPATADDIQQARQWSSKEPTGRSARYKSREFVESGTEDDPTQEESGLSTPSRQESPLPPEIDVRNARETSRQRHHHRVTAHRRDVTDHGDQRHRPQHYPDLRHRPDRHRQRHKKDVKFVFDKGKKP